MIEIDYAAVVRELVERPDPVPPRPFEVLPPAPTGETLSTVYSELIDQLIAGTGVPADVYQGVRPVDGFGPPLLRTVMAALAQPLRFSHETVSADVIVGDEYAVTGGES